MKKVGIINCSINNLFSIRNFIQLLGFDTIISNDIKQLKKSDYLILPGVGAFAEAKKRILENELDIFIKNFIKKGNLFLGICLGFQLMFEKSVEFEDCEGLNLVKGEIKPLKDSAKIVPHVGWNKVASLKKNLIKDSESKFYFIHSYYAKTSSSKDILFKSKYYDLEFCSGINKDNIYGFQFHPEKSGKNGFNLLNTLFKTFN